MFCLIMIMRFKIIFKKMIDIRNTFKGGVILNTKITNDLDKKYGHYEKNTKKCMIIYDELLK
jgi:hypothetical protein